MTKKDIADLPWHEFPSSLPLPSDADEAALVRLARAAEAARIDPGRDLTGLSDEDFLAALFGQPSPDEETPDGLA